MLVVSSSNRQSYWFFVDDYSESDIASMVTWLKYHNNPVEQVREKMAKTAKARASEIRTNKDKHVSQILTEYPRLVDTEEMVGSL